jgi:hypothetical protein
VQQKEIDAFVTNHNLKVQQKPENQSASSDANSSVLSGPGWNSVLIGYYSPSCLVVVALDRGEPAIKGDTTADDRLVVFGVEGTPGSCPAGLVQGPPKDMFVKQTPTKPEVNMRREIARR